MLAHPAITLLRAVVARDYGMWAFGVWGLVALLRFQDDGRPAHAAGWAACGAAAVLSRPDSIVLWATAVLAPLFHPGLPRRDRLARAALLVPLPVAATIGMVAAARNVPSMAAAVPGPSTHGSPGTSRSACPSRRPGPSRSP